MRYAQGFSVIGATARAFQRDGGEDDFPPGKSVRFEYRTHDSFSCRGSSKGFCFLQIYDFGLWGEGYFLGGHDERGRGEETEARERCEEREGRQNHLEFASYLYLRPGSHSHVHSIIMSH